MRRLYADREDVVGELIAERRDEAAREGDGPADAGER